MYVIEKGHPMPEAHDGRGQYPWRSMEVGDSFFVSRPTVKQSVLASSLSTCGRLWAKKHHLTWRFRVKNENEGVRVFRVK
jgi:hypothetical protein